jgi:cytochrome P450
MPGSTVDAADLLDKSLWRDPYPFFARLRRDDPVHWNTLTRAWYITRYRDVFELLVDARLTAPSHEPELARLTGSDRQVVATVREFLARWMLLSDPPYQTRVRALVHGAFTPATVSSLGAAIDRWTAEAVGRFAAAQGADLMADLTQPLALSVIAGLLGIAEPERDRVLAWSDTLMSFLNQADIDVEQARSALAAIDQLSEYVLGTVLPRDDGMVPRLLRTGLHEAALAPIEAVATFTQLLTGGIEPTANASGSAVLALHTYPEQHELLRTQKVSYRDAVEEVLRYDPPFHYSMSRRANADLTVGEVTIPRGDRVVLVLASANRDEDQFANADMFDVRRRPTRHLAFGRGGHYCLGAFLARKEMESLLRTLDGKLPRLRVDLQRAQRNPVFGATALGPVPVSTS